MDKNKRLEETIVQEQMRKERQLKGIEFNVRGDEVVMIFTYEREDFISTDPHYIAHSKDPEWLNLDEMNRIKIFLDEKGIPYRVRDDEFI